ncbi:MAG: hypothetical protein ABI946_00045 [Chthoniobacterales bacterium]
MKYKSHLITGFCVAAVAFCGTVNAAEKKSPAPKAAAMEKKEAAEPMAKKARAVPFRGKASAIDKKEKTFSIVGKTNTRVFKVMDKTTITKMGSPATFDGLTEDEDVTGSYLKQEDGSLEVKSLKIGGKTEAEKAAASASKTKRDAKKAAAAPAADAEATPAPKKK